MPPLLLLVDDSPEITLIVRRHCKVAGFELRAFDAVAPAWEYLQTSPLAEGPPVNPVLMLLDLNLPGESGLELCRRMQGARGLDRVPVALFGSWDLPEDIAAALRAGIDFVVEKRLLVESNCWAVRVREILESLDSRARRLSLSWKETQRNVPATEHQVSVFRQALCHTTLLQLGPEVGAALRQRVATRVAQRVDFPNQNLHDWLLPEGQGIHPSWLSRPETPALLSAYVELLADQVDGLLGAAAGASVRRDCGDLSPLPHVPS